MNDRAMSDQDAQRGLELLALAEQQQSIVTSLVASYEAATQVQAHTREELKTLVEQVKAAALEGARAGAARQPWQRYLLLAARSAGLVLAAILATWGAAWGAVEWQRYALAQLAQQQVALQGEIETMNNTLKDLAGQGGKIQLGVCTAQQRVCVKLAAPAKVYRIHGQPYLVLDGY